MEFQKKANWKKFNLQCFLCFMKSILNFQSPCYFVTCKCFGFLTSLKFGDWLEVNKGTLMVLFAPLALGLMNHTLNPLPHNDNSRCPSRKSLLKTLWGK